MDELIAIMVLIMIVSCFWLIAAVAMVLGLIVFLVHLPLWISSAVRWLKERKAQHSKPNV